MASFSTISENAVSPALLQLFVDIRLPEMPVCNVQWIYYGNESVFQTF